MAFRSSTAYKNKLLGTSSFNTIFLNGTIFLYSGTQPTTADAAIPTGLGSHLAQVTLSGVAWTAGSSAGGLQWSTPVGGVVSIPAGANWQYTGLSTGTIGWGRFVTNSADPGTLDTGFLYPRLDFAVGTTTGELLLSVVNVVSGTPGVIATATFTLA